MIVDIHGHTNAPPSLYAYKAGLQSSKGAHGKGNPGLNEEAMANSVRNHLANNLDKVGTDVQFLSPRPFQLMHSEKPEKIVHYWVEANNDAIAMSVKLAPTRYRGVAGLPQCAGVPITNTFDEIDRCINDLGFVGIMINPDPHEGTVLYNPEAIDLLVRIVGSDRCMFGTENPGTGSYKDPSSGKMLDDLKPVIEGIGSLTDQDKQNIFEDVPRKVFPRFKQ